MIRVTDLCKEFRVYKHHRGALGSVRNLFSRDYRRIHAVDRVTFHVRPGELVGYLGPNGAGKSTTIKMLTGILVPTSGEVRVAEWVPWRERIAYVRHIGVVFGQRTTLWWDLPVIESFDLLRHIYRIPADRHRQNLRRFREMLELDEFLDTPVRSLSLGQRMRADLAASLLHDPAVVFMDEPTIGLDVVAKQRIREFIRQTNEEAGTTIVLTTHDLGDVARLCQRIMIIDHGKLLFDGPLEELTERFGGERELLVDFAEFYDDVVVPGARVVERDGRRVTYRFSREDLSASELIARISGRYRILDLSVREPEIEETVRRIYEKQLLQEQN
jgi:ABC-2 type transport system ATP-binding protein